MITKSLAYILMAVTFFAAVGVVTFRNVFHSALLLGAALVGVAGLYLLMGAEFLAAVQILVYVGGILTLVIFAVMFTKNLSDKTVSQTNEQKFPAIIVSGLVFAMMAYGILKMRLEPSLSAPPIMDAANIGRVFFREYVLAFEILSIVLLVALIGAIVLAKKETRDDAR